MTWKLGETDRESPRLVQLYKTHDVARCKRFSREVLLEIQDEIMITGLIMSTESVINIFSARTPLKQHSSPAKISLVRR
jgi:hypothetical protein